MNEVVRPSIKTEQRVAVISGGSSGIGLAFVSALYGEGYKVIFCGRDKRKLQEAELSYPGVKGFVCDVADKPSLLRFAQDVRSEHAAVDLLISNAGGMREIDLNTIDIAGEDISAELRLNLEGAINFIAAFLPALRTGAPSSIVIVTSGYGLSPATRAPIYSAAKAGLRSFSKSLRRQLVPAGIGVTEVAPPLVDTPAVAHVNASKISSEQVVKMTLAAVRAGRNEVYPGVVRWLPLLLRIAPSFAESMVNKR